MLYECKNTDFNNLTCKLSNSIFQTPWYSFLLSMLVVFHFLRMNKVWDHQNVSPYKIESCKSRHHQCWCLPLWNKLTWKLELWLLQILLIYLCIIFKKCSNSCYLNWQQPLLLSKAWILEEISSSSSLLVLIRIKMYFIEWYQQVCVFSNLFL